MLASVFSRFTKCRLNLNCPLRSRCKRHSSYDHAMRTHLCGTLSLEHAQLQEPVAVCGWLQTNRFDNRFWLIRDWSGVIQVVLDDAKKEGWREMLSEGVPLESVVRVRGVPRKRPDGQENLRMPTGQIEIYAEDVEVLNRAPIRLPFSPSDRKVNESLRMQYRYLELRSSSLQKNLRLRSSVIMKMRQFLHDLHSFVEVETPYLFRRTPGGAREFLVPSQLPGKFYALAQSPQQFKQLLMVGGLDRYFQIARCFRDERNNQEKQPEFTQLDLEMSFVDMESIKDVVEDLIRFSWPDTLGLPPVSPFARISYKEAMETYGSDKPDVRFDMRFADITEWSRRHGMFSRFLSNPQTAARAFLAKGGAKFCKNAFKQTFERLLKKEYPGTGVFFVQYNNDGSLKPDMPVSAVSDLLGIESWRDQIEAGDLGIVCVGENDICSKALGRLRVETANYLESQGLKLRQDGFHFLWVESFPLFAPADHTMSEQQSAPGAKWETVHHPFTAPVKEDEHLLQTANAEENLSAIRGQHYDLVLNGAEVGGGSIRVHEAALQRHILSLLNVEHRELEHLLQALDSGCPPHGGIALGLDRLISIYAGENNIRQVMAFPKSASGRDLMADAPCSVPPEELVPYHIRVEKPVSTGDGIAVEAAGGGALREEVSRKISR